MVADQALIPWLEQVRRRVRARRGIRSMVTALVVWGSASSLLLLAARVVPLGWERDAATEWTAAHLEAAFTWPDANDEDRGLPSSSRAVAMRSEP